jgi:hypothetical protein
MIRCRICAAERSIELSWSSDLLALCGKRNPYPGKLLHRGRADLALVEGKPLEKINLIAEPAKNFKIIMKRGTVYKNMLTK